jgi:recombinational DNA repair ATPase RecF
MISTNRRQFLEDLLKQGPQLTPEQYDDYRRQLDQKINRTEREERQMRWFVAGAWLAALAVFACAVSLLVVHARGSFVNPLPDWFLAVMAEGLVLCPALGLLLLGLYLFKYRRRVSLAREEIQRAVFADLQVQMNVLRGKVDSMEKADPAQVERP